MPESKGPKWRKSPAQYYVYDGLKNGVIPLEGMAPKEVYENYCKDRPEFAAFGDKNFASRLRSLRAKVADKNNRAARDGAFLTDDRKVYPRPSQDAFGLPYWPDSDAKVKLAEDMDAGKHKILSGEQLWASRPEYYENYPVDTFIKHIFQEERSRKFLLYCQEQRNKKHYM